MTTGPQIAMNLIVNLSILGIFGTFTAMGEELGWRGYLQPRLDAAGVRGSMLVVWLCQLALLAPLMAGAGYADAGGRSRASLSSPSGVFRGSSLGGVYGGRSLGGAVFLHSFHNTISQWLFPKFFAGGEDGLWLEGAGFSRSRATSWWGRRSSSG